MPAAVPNSVKDEPRARNFTRPLLKASTNTKHFIRTHQYIRSTVRLYGHSTIICTRSQRVYINGCIVIKAFEPTLRTILLLTANS